MSQCSTLAGTFVSFALLRYLLYMLL